MNNPVSNNSNNLNSIYENIKSTVKDGRISGQEYDDLKVTLETSDIYEPEKSNLLKTLREVRFIALFERDNEVCKSKLDKLANQIKPLKDNQLASYLVDNLNNNIKENPLEKSDDLVSNSLAESYDEWYTPQYADYEKSYQSFHQSGITLEKNNAILAHPEQHSKDEVKENQVWRTAYSSCGPAAAIMVLKANSFVEDISVEDIRTKMNVGKRGAVSLVPIATIIEKLSENKLDSQINNAKKGESSKDFLERIKKSLQQDKMVILLTQFMDEFPENDVSKVGHYVIVNGVDDNHLLISNPFTDGILEEIPIEEFTDAYNYRQKRANPGQPNAFISVSKLP